ncbi:hypothetical protein Hanom_Chr03g00217331 [Helianthus anomalus]
MCGKVAYHQTFRKEMERGLAPVARKCFEDGTLKQMKEDDEIFFMLNGGLINQDSFDTFSKIAYQCLEENQWKRPTTQEIIEELQKAYDFQVSNSFQYITYIFRLQYS